MGWTERCPRRLLYRECSLSDKTPDNPDPILNNPYPELPLVKIRTLVRFDAYSASNSIGSGHSENQDSYLADMSALIFAVADGVGGYEGGKVASDLAIGALRNRAGEIQNEFVAKAVLEDIHEQCFIRPNPGITGTWEPLSP